MKIVLWAITTGLFYHLIAGFKHLIMDLGWGETKGGAQMGAQITLGLAVLAAALAGVWIW